MLVISPPLAAASISDEALDGFLTNALARLSVKEAASAAAEHFIMPRKGAYARALELNDLA